FHRVGRAHVEAYEPDRPVLQDVEDVVGREEVVRVADDGERAGRWALDEPDGGAQHEGARPFGADERSGDVEAALGEQRGEAVSGNAPGNVRKPLAYQLAVAVADGAEPAVELGFRPAVGDDGLQLLVRRRPEREAVTVVGEDLEFLDLVRRARPLAVELG